MQTQAVKAGIGEFRQALDPTSDRQGVLQALRDGRSCGAGIPARVPFRPPSSGRLLHKYLQTGRRCQSFLSYDHHNREDRSGVCPISLVPPTALASRTDAVSLDFRGGGVMIAVATAAD